MIVISALWTSCAVAQVEPAAPPPLQFKDIPGQPTDLLAKDAPSGDDTIVCNYQHETGSLLVTRVCRTLRAWKIMQSDSREFLEFQHLGAHQAGEHS